MLAAQSEKAERIWCDKLHGLAVRGGFEQRCRTERRRITRIETCHEGSSAVSGASITTRGLCRPGEECEARADGPLEDYGNYNTASIAIATRRAVASLQIRKQSNNHPNDGRCARPKRNLRSCRRRFSNPPRTPEPYYLSRQMRSAFGISQMEPQATVPGGQTIWFY